MIQGNIFKIKRFSLHDGPGIRTSVFLKGCPMRCAWCHSPEGLNDGYELWHDKSLCIGCGLCVTACNLKALELHSDAGHEIHINRNACNLNGDCVKVCPSGAVQFTGRHVTSDEVVEGIVRDKMFYDVSGGGMTISGGEPLFQPEFTRELLMKCREANISTAIETCMFAKWEIVERLSEYIDLFIIDLKIIDPSKHKKYTGQTNEIIFENFRRLASAGRNIIVRVPIVKGITDTSDNLESIRDFVSSTGMYMPIEYIQYNVLAGNNYKRLGIQFGIQDL